MDLKGRCIGENKDYVLVRTRMLQVDYEQTGPLSHKVYKKKPRQTKSARPSPGRSFHTLVCGAALLDKPRDT